MPSFSPSLASLPCPWRSASSRGPAVLLEGEGAPLAWDEPQACAQGGKGPVGGSRTRCWDRPALHGAGPGHHLLPPAPAPVPSLPPAAPRPWPDPDAGIAAAKLQKQSEPFEAGEESPGGVGGPEAAAWGKLLRQCQGSAERRGGGQEGGMAEGRRQGQKVPVGCWSSLLYSTSCCCWVASLTTCGREAL